MTFLMMHFFSNRFTMLQLLSQRSSSRKTHPITTNPVIQVLFKTTNWSKHVNLENSASKYH